MLFRSTAVIGMTPYEAAFGKKPDLSDVREWGDKVWVRLEVKGNKLGGRVREGQWMGISDKSKGICVYWPDKKTVLIKRNVYFDNMQLSVSCLEGEEWELTETKTHNPLYYLSQNWRSLKSSQKYHQKMMKIILSLK